MSDRTNRLNDKEELKSLILNPSARSGSESIN